MRPDMVASVGYASNAEAEEEESQAKNQAEQHSKILVVFLFVCFNKNKSGEKNNQLAKCRRWGREQEPRLMTLVMSSKTMSTQEGKNGNLKTSSRQFLKTDPPKCTPFSSRASSAGFLIRKCLQPVCSSHHINPQDSARVFRSTFKSHTGCELLYHGQEQQNPVPAEMQSLLSH